MATNSKPAPSKSTAITAPKAPPSPAVQAARERFAMMNRNRTSSTPTAPAPRKPQPMVPSARPSKETLGSIIGEEAPTLIAGAALGALNSSELGKGIAEKLGVQPSRAVGAIAVVAKVLNVDGIAGPTVRQSLNAALRSEANDFARWGGSSLMSMVGTQLKKPAEEPKHEPAPPPAAETKAPETSGITVKEVTHANGAVNGSANGAASHAAAPKVTHEKNVTDRA